MHAEYRQLDWLRIAAFRTHFGCVSEPRLPAYSPEYQTSDCASETKLAAYPTEYQTFNCKSDPR